MTYLLLPCEKVAVGCLTFWLASIAKVPDSLPRQASQLTNFLGPLIMPEHSCNLYAPTVDELHLW